ncbi:MAG: CGNR zinc finger domain-containing protein, partial [Anaerolineales bacterium]
MTNESFSEREWDFDGGMLPLDFANTAEWHLSSAPDDLLTDYSDLVGWSQAAGLINENVALSLLADAAKRPEQTKAVFKRAHAMREATFRIFKAVAEGEKPTNKDLALINEIHQEASSNLHVRPSPEGFQWEWGSDSLDWVLGPIAHSAAELLTSSHLDRVGICADEDRGCGYLFFDTSRNHSRKWCSMESCGNRAKAKRHYKRQTNTLI